MRSSTNHSTSHHVSNTQEWRERLARRARRRAAIELFGSILATSALAVALYVQFRTGSLSGVSFAAHAETAILVSLGVLYIALLISPSTVGSYVVRITHITGSFVIDIITIIALTIVFCATFPLARLAGRRSFIARHNPSTPWVARSSNWRRSTWAPKTEECARSTRGGTLWQLMGYFVARKNGLLLIVFLIVLTAVSVSALSNSTYLAPFVYTLF